ncbi:hypothetical protein HYX10_04995 [Candidatus Woesearchaeota archaeon]|nr:hypothetical protein [Candidatus Woesearchaeota archaeon]
MFFNSSGEKPVIEQADVADVNLDEVPKGPIHWHPELTVIIKGEVQNIPRNLGLGSVHKPVHTHDDVPVLHYENSRPTAETVTLGYFFSDVWRKTFNSQCIFSYCSGAEGNLSMTVNGKPNFQFDNYIPKDGDKIVIMFG